MTHYIINVNIKKVSPGEFKVTRGGGSAATEREIEDVLSLVVRAETITEAVAKTVNHMKIEAQTEIDDNTKKAGI